MLSDLIILDKSSCNLVEQSMRCQPAALRRLNLRFPSRTCDNQLSVVAERGIATADRRRLQHSVAGDTIGASECFDRRRKDTDGDHCEEAGLLLLRPNSAQDGAWSCSAAADSCSSGFTGAAWPFLTAPADRNSTHFRRPMPCVAHSDTAAHHKWLSHGRSLGPKQPAVNHISDRHGSHAGAIWWTDRG